MKYTGPLPKIGPETDHKAGLYELLDHLPGGVRR